MQLIKICLSVILLFSTGSIYDFQITDIDGNTINLSNFQGKKILFVNTSTNSKYVDQYSSLDSLYEKYSDSLVIIAVPSDDFGNEPNDNDSIKAFVTSHYNIHYILASKSHVSGDSILPVYNWLTHKDQNNYFENPINGDFLKFLVNSEGDLISISSGELGPMDSIIQHQIETQ